jgi:hypothetical protein
MTVAIATYSHDPYLLEVRTGFAGRFLCEHGFHDFSRWQRVPGTLTEGRKRIEVTLQVRECVRPSCGFAEKKLL